MRKNPYNKDLKDQLPLFMQGPITITALVKNEEQKAIVEKTRLQKREYEVKGLSFTKRLAFTMVQPPVFNPDFTPNHPDILDIEMCQTEVTQKFFQAVMGWNDSKFQENHQNPVESVSWYDCISFCNKLSELLGFQSCYRISDIRINYQSKNIGSAVVTWDEAANGFRLPTVSEWGLFAKAGTQNQWAGTDVKSELKQYAWYNDNSGMEPHPVGEKLPNEWGLYDMTGNVSEWCWDKVSPSDDSMRKLCGGSYRDSADLCQVAKLRVGFAGNGDHERGFRICRTIK